MWRPREIIVHRSVKDDPVTQYLLNRCPDVPVKETRGGEAKDIIRVSDILKGSGSTMLEKILVGKQVIYLAPAGNAVDTFSMPDDRMKCPHFHRVKFASNGCFYQCDWCYLKLTYRVAFPFITIRTQYDVIKQQIEKELSETDKVIMFNSGELADSLAVEHLTRAGREFIPWFGRSHNGYLFMLTKSDNVDPILSLPHNRHTILAWSINNEKVSRKYEIGAPPFEKRLAAARKAQEAGYPVRLRLDPIVPIEGWQNRYSETIHDIFGQVTPERITIGTLRFEKGFYHQRYSILTTGRELSEMLEKMQPMFPPKKITGYKKPKSGKYSFSDEQRFEVFRFIIHEIRKYSDCPIALCKESATLWDRLKLDLSKCRCVCQYDFADVT